MNIIRLKNKVWKYYPDKPIGEGGIGKVFEGEDEQGTKVAIKCIKKNIEKVGHRELRIADSFVGKNFKNIISVHYAGLDQESNKYFIVMDLAQKSLQESLKEKKFFSEHETVEILMSIIHGLEEVPEIVHRDLKPNNILLHNNTWKIADFGISKFIEESTSSNTLKEWRTPQYAAPEQWELEKTSQKTDIYALGCIAYCLLSGAPPFRGPDKVSFKLQHLYESPARLKNINPLLCSIIFTMLSKIPESRPSLNMLKQQLQKLLKNAHENCKTETEKELKRIGLSEAELGLKSEVETKHRIKEKESRKLLAIDAYKSLLLIVERLFDIIQDNAPSSYISNGTSINIRQKSLIELGNAQLLIDYLIELCLDSGNRFKHSDWDALAAAIIAVHQKRPEYRWEANLWYMKISPSEDFRWYEVAYMNNPLLPNTSRFTPFALKNVKDADLAAAHVISEFQFAHSPVPIDYENMEPFIERWIKRFTDACKSQLKSPANLPFKLHL